MLLNSIFIKSLSSALSLVLNLILLFFLSNFLTKFEFGLFNYLTTIGSQMIFILTSGFSRSYVHFYSQNTLIKNEIVKTYININIIIIIIFIVLTQLFIFNDFFNNLIFDHKIEYLLINLGLISGLLNFTFEKVGEIYDSDQSSIKFDFVKFFLRLTVLLTVFTWFFFEFLNLITLLVSLIVFNFFSIILLLKNYYTKNINKTISILKIVKQLSSYYFIFAPFTVLVGVYELLYRVVINSDLGIKEQGIYGFSFLIFAACSIPFHSISNILLSFASRNKIVFSRVKINNYFLICNSIIIPMLIISATLLNIYYNFFINLLTDNFYKVSNLSLFGLLIWSVVSTYDILVYSSVISTNNFKKYLNAGMLICLIFILILIFFLYYDLSFTLEFYFLFLCITPSTRLLVGLILGYSQFGKEMFFKINHTLFYLFLCLLSLFLFEQLDNYLLSTLIMSVGIFYWFYNLFLIYKINLNVK